MNWNMPAWLSKRFRSEALYSEDYNPKTDLLLVGLHMTQAYVSLNGPGSQGESHFTQIGI